MSIIYSKKRKKSRFKEIIFSHIENNIKQYLIISIVFIIGIIIGVIFINNLSENHISDITNYITSFVEDLKNNKDVNTLLLLKESIRKNLILGIFLWFMGSTVIGISIVYLTVCFRGFCLGYTISSIILSLGVRKRYDFFNFFTFIAEYIIHTLHINP